VPPISASSVMSLFLRSLMFMWVRVSCVRAVGRSAGRREGEGDDGRWRAVGGPSGRVEPRERHGDLLRVRRLGANGKRRRQAGVRRLGPLLMITATRVPVNKFDQAN
jgi:hypothetical protein